MKIGFVGQDGLQSEMARTLEMDEKKLPKPEVFKKEVDAFVEKMMDKYECFSVKPGSSIY